MDTSGNTKRIESYLHLYLGQPFERRMYYASDGSHHSTIRCAQFRAIDLAQYNEPPSVNIGKVEDILHLRNLSSMTEEERQKLIKCGPLPCEWQDIMEEAERTKYLLSIGMDLFGLIESGLAIDQSKL